MPCQVFIWTWSDVIQLYSTYRESFSAKWSDQPFYILVDKQSKL